jgi:hypothetical protein
MELSKSREETLADWLAALRSGKYKKGEGRLCRLSSTGEGHYCCLGVLCEIVGVPGHLNALNGSSVKMFEVDGHQDMSYLPQPVADAMGLRNRQGTVGLMPSVRFKDQTYEGLANLNDSAVGITFNDIANIIEANHDKFFTWEKAADTPVSAGPPTLLDH